jgi:F0F1-type ATP synthase delta subunit
MKTFKQYLMESTKEYKFRVKYAGTLTDAQLNRVEMALGKYNLNDMSKPKVTPIQEHPMDFQTMKNSEVSIMDISLTYPTTVDMLRNELQEYAGIPGSHLIVMNPNDPNEVSREKNLEEQDKDYETKLGSEIKDDMEIKAEEHFGDKYNENFLKDLAKNKETPEVSLAKAYADEVAKETKKKD